LRAGTQISAAYRSKLLELGIRLVYVEDTASRGIEPAQLVSSETRRLATRAVAGAFAASGRALHARATLPASARERLQTIVDRILADVEASGGIAVALADLASADAYEFQHSIDVAALGILIGNKLLRERGWVDWRGQRQFNRIGERLQGLGLGLLLHDVGKLAIPAEILAKDSLATEEWELVRSHPRLGLELLRGDDLSPLVKAVVLRHHEHWDGSGFPDGKSGTEIHEMARIAAVANVYDKVTSERPRVPAKPPHVGVRTILEGAGTQFDPDIVEVFAALVAPFPAGSPVRLTDGRSGVVVSVPDGHLDRPRVRVLSGDGGPEEIALLEHPNIGIDGWSVSAPEPQALGARGR
jgi:HD-GYP domain-containing protein (c-di-GMP phosphodiesterase class II)